MVTIFVQATMHKVYMYAKFEYLYAYRFFVIKCLKFWFIIIF
jgi:hypothetical protein